MRGNQPIEDLFLGTILGDQQPDARQTAVSNVASALGIGTPEFLALAVYYGSHYFHWRVPKASGGFRTLSAPHPDLAELQREILGSVIRSSDLVPHVAATAFSPGCSSLSNAMAHKGRQLVIRLDIQDFFPSIGFGHVEDVFLAIGQPSLESRILAWLTTMPVHTPSLTPTEVGRSPMRCLPQGAATSPALANLVCRDLDARINEIAIRWGYVFTRYCDDIVLSTDRPDANIDTILAGTYSALEVEGFRANPDKLRVMWPHQRQMVTGLVVNDGTPRVSRRRVREFRAFLHLWETAGIEAARNRLNQSSRPGHERDPASYAAGFLSYLNSVHPPQAQGLVRRYPWIQTAAPSLPKSLKTGASI